MFLSSYTSLSLPVSATHEASTSQAWRRFLLPLPIPSYGSLTTPCLLISPSRSCPSVLPFLLAPRPVGQVVDFAHRGHMEASGDRAHRSGRDGNPVRAMEEVVHGRMLQGVMRRDPLPLAAPHRGARHGLEAGSYERTPSPAGSPRRRSRCLRRTGHREHAEWPGRRGRFLLVEPLHRRHKPSKEVQRRTSRQPDSERRGENSRKGYRLDWGSIYIEALPRPPPVMLTYLKHLYLFTQRQEPTGRQTSMDEFVCGSLCAYRIASLQVACTRLPQSILWRAVLCPALMVSPLAAVVSPLGRHPTVVPGTALGRPSTLARIVLSIPDSNCLVNWMNMIKHKCWQPWDELSTLVTGADALGELRPAS